MARWAIATVLALSFAAPPGLPAERADAPPPGASDLTERVEVSLVLVEAVVLDRAGRHVKGLPREAFAVLEDGREVVIAAFDEIDSLDVQARPSDPATGPPPPAPREPGGGDRRATAPPGEPESPVAPAAENRRRFVFLFDGYNNASALRLVQARRAVKEFIRSEMRPGDEAALYEISPFLRSLVPLTRDRTRLEDAVDDIRYFPGESLGKQIIDSSVYTGTLGSRSQVQDRILRNAEFGADQAAAEQRQYFRSLAALGRVMEEVPGRKTVMLFSGGFPIMVPPEDLATGGFTWDFKNMIRQLERSRASVYAMNIGEEAGLTDATQRTNLSTELDRLGFGAEFLDQMGLGNTSGGDTALAYNQFAAVLSHESGGRFFPGYDYHRSLAAVADDTRHFYLIGYEPPDAQPGHDRPDGRYRMIEVRVDRKRVRVMTRTGRYAEPEPTPAGSSSAPARRVERTGHRSEEPEVAHELGASPVYFPGKPGRTLVVLPVMLSGPVSPVERPEGGFDLDISTRVVARTGGMEVERREHNYRIGFDDPTLRDALGRGLRLTEAVEVPPGDYELEAVVRLNGLALEAAWRSAAAVPGFDTGGFSVSGLALLADDSAPPLVADVFTAARDDPALEAPEAEDPFRLSGDRRAVGAASPSVDPMRPLTCFFRVHHPSLAVSVAPDDLSVEYSLVPEAGGLGLLLPTRLVYFEPGVGGRSFDAVARLDLRAVEPGAYRLRVAVRDGNGREAVQERPVVVDDLSKILDSGE